MSTVKVVKNRIPERLMKRARREAIRHPIVLTWEKQDGLWHGMINKIHGWPGLGGLGRTPTIAVNNTLESAAIILAIGFESKEKKRRSRRK